MLNIRSIHGLKAISLVASAHNFQPVTSTTWSKITLLPCFGASAYACAYRFVTSTLAFIDNFPSSSTPHRGRPHPLTRGKSVRHSTLLRGDYV